MTTTTLETGLSLHCERVGHVYSTPTGDTVAPLTTAHIDRQPNS